MLTYQTHTYSAKKLCRTRNERQVVEKLICLRGIRNYHNVQNCVAFYAESEDERLLQN